MIWYSLLTSTWISLATLQVSSTFCNRSGSIQFSEEFIYGTPQVQFLPSWFFTKSCKRKVPLSPCTKHKDVRSSSSGNANAQQVTWESGTRLQLIRQGQCYVLALGQNCKPLSTINHRHKVFWGRSRLKCIMFRTSAQEEDSREI